MHGGCRGGGQRGGVRVVPLGHALLPVVGGDAQQAHHDLRLLLGVCQDLVVLGVGGGVAHDGRPEDLGEAGEGHLVGVAGSYNALEVEDEEGQRVLVGRRELRNGLEDGGKGVLVSTCCTLQERKENNVSIRN